MRNRLGSKVARLLSVVFVAGVIGASLPCVSTTLGRHAAKHQQTSTNDLTAFLAQATKQVNTHRAGDVKTLADPAAAGSFGWVTASHESWEGSALTLPTVFPDGESVNLAVFHAWHSCQSNGDHVYRLRRTDGNWQLGLEIPETETLGFRVRDHDLHVSFDIPQKNASLSDTVQVERTSDRVPSFGLLRISQDFHVKSITLGDATGKMAVPFRQEGGIIAFIPPTDRKFALTFALQRPISDNRESDYIRADEAVLCSYWYAHIARLPARTTVTATTPPDWKAIAQGELTSERKSPDGTTTLTFRNEVPNCFYTLDIGRYTITRRAVKNRTLCVYQLRPNPALAQRCLDTLSASLDYYDRTFAPFPFTRYAIVETQGAFPGALEAYSFATFGPNTLPELIPHELAHTWWGGVTPCTYTHSMWDEAFAEYSDDLFHRSQETVVRKTTPLDTASAGLLANRRKIASAFSAIPVAQAFDTEDDRHIAAGYEKGHQVLKMLEMQLGQPVMLRCMRRFFADHPKGEAADWPEFEAAVQKETGQDYHWFFAEWLERKGVPMLALAHTTYHQEADGYMVETDVVQDGAPYRLKMPVLLENRQGDPSQVDYSGDRRRDHASDVPCRLSADAPVPRSQGERSCSPPRSALVPLPIRLFFLSRAECHVPGRRSFTRIVSTGITRNAIPAMMRVDRGDYDHEKI